MAPFLLLSVICTGIGFITASLPVAQQVTTPLRNASAMHQETGGVRLSEAAGGMGKQK